tara:strand:+ start:15533 stop:15955 length:423 start_codon:yes stop_codon:yes gene_type:complete
MLLWIGFTQVESKVIEWTDVERKRPSAFIVSCPKCEAINWSKIDDLYMAYDRTHNNFKCKGCGSGKLKPGEKHPKRPKRPAKPEPSLDAFKPRSPGWRSLSDNNANKKRKNKRTKKSSTQRSKASEPVESSQEDKEKPEK